MWSRGERSLRELASESGDFAREGPCCELGGKFIWLEHAISGSDRLPKVLLDDARSRPTTTICTRAILSPIPAMQGNSGGSGAGSRSLAESGVARPTSIRFSVRRASCAPTPSLRWLPPKFPPRSQRTRGHFLRWRQLREGAFFYVNQKCRHGPTTHASCFNEHFIRSPFYRPTE